MTRWIIPTLLFLSACPSGNGVTAQATGATPRHLATAQSTQTRPTFVIAIDAGHGGKDAGALGPSGEQEKAIVLAIARKLARLIRHEPGMRGVMVRNGDDFVGLHQRAAIAREARADLFISLHADAYGDEAVQGSSVFTLSETGATSEAARCLADRENAGLVGGVDLKSQDAMLASVLVDLSKNATQEASDLAATQLLAALQQAFKLHNPVIQKAGFAVLKSLDMPSVLIETGFISNPDEAARLLDPGHQEQLAHALLQGIRAYAQQSARLPGDPLNPPGLPAATPSIPAQGRSRPGR